MPQHGTYKVILNSDDKQFGGEERIDSSVKHYAMPEPWSDRPNKMMVYIPCRTAIVYALGMFYISIF